MKLSFAIKLVLLIGLTGCNKLILRQPVLPDKHDWKMFAGSIQRLNFTEEALIPPLVKAWEYDASAGFGPFGATINGNIISIGNLRGEVHLVDKINGKGLGMKDFGTAIYAPPVLDANILFLALSDENGSMLAYDLSRGSIVWRKSFGRIESAILLLNDNIIASTVDNGLMSIDKKDGSVIWKYPQPNNRRQPTSHSSPAACGETIVCGMDDGLIVAVNSNDGSLLWHKRIGSGLTTTPSIQGNNIFIGTSDGKVLSLELSTGNILWSTDVGGKIYSSAAIGEGRIFVVTARNEILCLKKGNGDIVWRVAPGLILGSSPLLAKNILYLGSFDEYLYALESDSGKVIWKFKAEGRIVSPPVISNGLLYILTEDRSLVALRKGEGE